MPRRRNDLRPPAAYLRRWPNVATIDDATVAGSAARVAAILAGRLRTWRGEQGLTRAELARRADLAPQTIANIEEGASWADLVSIAALAEAFGVGPEELIAPTVDPT
jgi:DNA-binding XRE family transcriptional regulator